MLKDFIFALQMIIKKKKKATAFLWPLQQRLS
jgi:hypothetical protein